MKPQRSVYIELANGTYFVKYAVRKPCHRYCAASFYAKDTDLKTVVKWVHARPELILIEKPSE